MRRTVDYGSSSPFVITEIIFENAIVIDDNASARFKREVYRRDKKATFYRRQIFAYDSPLRKSAFAKRTR